MKINIFRTNKSVHHSFIVLCTLHMYDYFNRVCDDPLMC